MTALNTDELNALSQQIIGCAFAVHNVLGSGFLEKVYENALCIEFEKNGLDFEAQKSVNVYYDKKIVGEFTPDVLVAGKIILELKSAKAITEAHQAQCINYLKATGLPICLLINFGRERVELKRFINPFLNLRFDK